MTTAAAAIQTGDETMARAKHDDGGDIDLWGRRVERIGIPFTIVIGIGFLAYSAGRWAGPALLEPLVTSLTTTQASLAETIKRQSETAQSHERTSRAIVTELENVRADIRALRQAILDRKE